MATKEAITDAVNIKQKAQAIDDFIWNNSRSPEGLVYCFVMSDTLSRPTIDEICNCVPVPDALEDKDSMYDGEKLDIRWVDSKPQYLMQGVPLEDVESYEDSLFATGLYLSSLCFRYRATLDGEMLRRAKSIFDAMYRVYELGLQEQPGWIPKPYGFKCSKQSSMDNQCPYYQAMIRYYPIAPTQDKERIIHVLKAIADYWMSNKYKMHLSYFGEAVDYDSNMHYPGHWPLAFLPLFDAVWKLTDDDRYFKEYEYLYSRLTLEDGKDPQYLIKKIACLHRWYYELGALLEQNAKDCDKFREGLDYQIKAIEIWDDKKWLDGYSAEMQHYKWMYLPHSEKDRQEIKEKLLNKKWEDFLYIWPCPPYKCVEWRDRAFYMVRPASWLETYWRGRLRGDW